MPAKLYTPTADEVDAALTALTQRQPTEATRFERAAAIVLAGALDHDAQGWSATSMERARRGYAYRLTPQTCECYDHERTRMACKHLDAMRLYGRVLAARMDATIVALQSAAEATATAGGWRAFNEGLDAENALAAAEYARQDLVLGDDTLFVLPGSQSNVIHLYDRVTGDAICSALQQPSGHWRPLEAADTVEWARWLGAQQGELEGVTVDAVALAPPPDFAARAKLQARVSVSTPGSPYKYDQRQAAKGKAPVMQLTIEAAKRRKAALGLTDGEIQRAMGA